MSGRECKDLNCRLRDTFRVQRQYNLSFNYCQFLLTFAIAGEPYVADTAFPVA
jgi:hypothetical protein